MLEPECTEDPQACLWLGDMYHWAQGVAADEEAARNYYQKGMDLLDRDCTDKIADACMDLQSRYETGNGVGPDPSKANSYLRKAERIYCVEGGQKICFELRPQYNP